MLLPAGHDTFLRGLAFGGSHLFETSITVVPDKCTSTTRGHFDYIYSSGKWGTKLKMPSEYYGYAHWPPQLSRKKSSSGSGSALGNTETSLEVIVNMTRKFGATSLLDIPCGDANWIFDSYETDTLPIYVGLDVTKAVVELNTQRFAHHSNKKFMFWDATECPLPKFRNITTGEEQPFDLVHVRDVIQHLSVDQGVKYFCNVFKSEAKVLITTTYPDGKNVDIKEGDFYQNNLEQEPFSFPASGNCIPTHPNEEGGGGEDSTCVYDLTAGTWRQEFIDARC